MAWPGPFPAEGILFPLAGIVKRGKAAQISAMSPLRVADLLKRSGLTAYQLSKQSAGRISMSAAYRLANGEVERLSAETVSALCDILSCEPSDLFVLEKGKRR